MRSFINKAFAFIALLSVLPAFNSPQITDVFVDPYTNGLLYTLYSEQKVDIDNVSSWMSPHGWYYICLLYTSPSPRDGLLSRMPSSA